MPGTPAIQLGATKVRSRKQRSRLPMLVVVALGLLTLAGLCLLPIALFPTNASGIQWNVYEIKRGVEYDVAKVEVFGKAQFADIQNVHAKVLPQVRLPGKEVRIVFHLGGRGESRIVAYDAGAGFVVNMDDKGLLKP